MVLILKHMEQWETEWPAQVMLALNKAPNYNSVLNMETQW